MIGWLTRLFGRKDAAGYTQGERRIFPFWDGKRHRVADPLAVHRTMLTDPDFDMKLDPSIAEVPTVEGVKAAGRVAAATRKAFELPSFPSGGLTDSECLMLFCEFGDYIGRITENARPLASSPGHTASADDDCLIPSGADSG